uniref:FliF n=2 Tax=Pseudomonadati TaxID=3379134 RepID=O06680_TREDN|nr:FliF [Treponema denticola]
MNEKFNNLKTKFGTLWGKWTKLQKGIIIGVIVLALVLVVVLGRWSSKPTSVAVIDMAITDVDLRDRIILRINEGNVKTSISSDGIISVADVEATARRMRTILLREDLIPKNTSPWAFFDVERYSRTDFEREIDVRRAITEEVKRHLKALDDIDDANVVVRIPEKALFESEQLPATATVVITPAPGSDISTNRKKIEGIQKMLRLAVPGLKNEDITISDASGIPLNDFEIMKDADRLTLIEKQQKFIAKLERQYGANILTPLQKIYGEDRVRDINVKIDMDMSERSADTTEIRPTVIKEDNPETSYDDSQVVQSVTVSSENATTVWEGRINPQGPTGTEGQTPPSYQDTRNLVGRSTQTITKENHLVSSSQIKEVFLPKMGRRTVSVNIDGVWEKKKDVNGKYINLNGVIEREYKPLSAEEIKQAEKIIKDAIGFDASRKDSVSVVNVKVDRTSQFELEDKEYFKALQRQTIFLLSLAGIALILIFFILYRIISREIERRKRLREEELLRQAQLERERMLYDQQMADADVSMTVEERRRQELQENAINMAREHPEDVALLIRTWLMEE